jgi:hypothetical protein
VEIIAGDTNFLFPHQSFSILSGILIGGIMKIIQPYALGCNSPILIGIVLLD